MSLFSVGIIYMTVHFLIKAFNIAIERKEISKPKYRFLVSASIAVGLSISTVLPIGYYKLIEFIL